MDNVVVKTSLAYVSGRLIYLKQKKHFYKIKTTHLLCI